MRSSSISCRDILCMSTNDFGTNKWMLMWYDNHGRARVPRYFLAICESGAVVEMQLTGCWSNCRQRSLALRPYERPSGQAGSQWAAYPLRRQSFRWLMVVGWQSDGTERDEREKSKYSIIKRARNRESKRKALTLDFCVFSHVEFVC